MWKFEGTIREFDEPSRGKTNGSAGSGRPSSGQSGNRWDSLSPVSRVRQFMERYARAGGDGSVQPTDLRATITGPPRPALAPAEAEVPAAAVGNLPAPRNGDDPSAKVATTPLVCETNGHCDEHEPDADAVVIVEVTNEVPDGPAPRTPSSDEILFIE